MVTDLTKLAAISGVMKCLVCDIPIDADEAREHGLCSTCLSVFWSPEEAARSFEWAAQQFGYVPPEDRIDARGGSDDH